MKRVRTLPAPRNHRCQECNIATEELGLCSLCEHFEQADALADLEDLRRAEAEWQQ